MMERKYHYLIAGLPDLHFGEFKEWTPLPAFYRSLRRDLHPDDCRMVKLMLLKEDNDHLLSFLQTGEVHHARHGNFNADDFKEQISLFSSILPAKDILPPYMVNILRKHEYREEEPDFVQYSHELAEGYYHHVMEHGSRFLKTFTIFNYNLDNLLAFMKAREFGMDPKRFITGDSGLTKHLEHASDKILTADPEFDWFEEISAIACISPFSEAELKADNLRWRIIDDLTFFEDFSLDWILGYIQKMQIINRWSQLDIATGEKKLRKLADRRAHEIPIQADWSEEA